MKLSLPRKMGLFTGDLQGVTSTESPNPLLWKGCLNVMCIVACLHTHELYVHFCLQLRLIEFAWIFPVKKGGKILISCKRSLHRSEHRFHYILLQSTHARKAQERNKSYMAMNEQATKLLLCWATLVKAINIQFLTGSQSISTRTRRSSVTQ